MLPPVRSMALLNLQVCLILCVIPKRSSRELEGCWRILPRFKGGRPWTGRKQAGPHLVSLKGKPLGSYMVCWNIGKEEMIMMLPQAWIMYDVVCYSSWSSSYVMLKWTSRESKGCQRRLPLLSKWIPWTDVNKLAHTWSLPRAAPGFPHGWLKHPLHLDTPTRTA